GRGHGLSTQSPWYGASPFPNVTQTKTILPDGSTLLTLTDDPSVSPDGVSKVTRVAVDTAGAAPRCVEQSVGTAALTDTDARTFSIFIQPQNTGTVRLELFGNASPVATIATYQAVGTPPTPLSN